MPRKRKTPEPESTKPDGYEILIGFIKNFTYNNPSDEESLNGHPAQGRCYRIIKDTQGYRIHIGRENNEHGLDGLFLGKKLTGKAANFSYDIEVVTPANYLELKINKEDTKKVVEWLATDNADMWERLQAEADGTAVVLKKLSEVIKFREEMEGRDEEGNVHRQKAAVDFSVPNDETGLIHPQDIINAERLSVSLNSISYKDPAMFFAILDLLEYVSTAYSDKYENTEFSNFSKEFITKTSSLGKGATMFTMLKYIQRYSTNGYEKSNNKNDIFKALHYGLFEIMRRNYLDKKTDE